VIETEDFNFYEKMKVPAPTFCPLCRAERRLTFRNERKLFKAKDAFTGKDIFSLYRTKAGKSPLLWKNGLAIPGMRQNMLAITIFP